MNSFVDFQARYVFDSKTDGLGERGQATVFKAWDREADHFVAIKRAFKKSNSFTLEEEYKLVNGLEHPNIAHFLAYHQYNLEGIGVVEYLIMRYYEYGNLDVFLAERNPDSTTQDRLLCGILEGLAFLHQKGLIHRDLKGENILVKREGEVFVPQLADFGLGKEGGSLEKSSGLNSAIGMTLSYAAPEQIEGGSIRPNVNLWAFGVLTYKMQTGRLPFEGESSQTSRKNQEIRQRITQGNLPADINEIAEPYQAIIRRCLVVDRKARAQQASELLAMLDTAKETRRPLSKESVKTLQTEEVQKVAAPARKASVNNRKLALAGGTGLLLILALLWWWPAENTTDVVEFDLTALEESMVYVKGGEFKMGCSSTEEDCESHEQPKHDVRVGDFYLSNREVTVADFAAFVHATGYKTVAEKEGSSQIAINEKQWKTKDINWEYNSKGKLHATKDWNHPVVHLGWDDANAFCHWLSVKTGKNYRLPTEAEWEYAARGGVKSKGFKYAGGNELSAVACWDEKDDNSGGTLPVKSKKPNELGLYDMSGNVWEWCSDGYEKNYYKSKTFDNPNGVESAALRAKRGGGWASDSTDCRVSNRHGVALDWLTAYDGFRVARSVD